MEIKTPTRFEAFLDGVCDIYEIDGENRLARERKLHLCYADLVIGAKRHYAARAAQTSISRVIRLPQRRCISSQDAVVIGQIRYEIEQVQQINDTNPPVMDLTLRQIGMHMEANER